MASYSSSPSVALTYLKQGLNSVARPVSYITRAPQSHQAHYYCLTLYCCY